MSGEARRAKKEVQEVMRLLSKVERGREERSEPTDTRVEDMTPVLEGAGKVSVMFKYSRDTQPWRKYV